MLLRCAAPVTGGGGGDAWRRAGGGGLTQFYFFYFFSTFFTLVEHCVEQKTPLQAILRFLNLHEFT